MTTDQEKVPLDAPAPRLRGTAGRLHAREAGLVAARDAGEAPA